MDGGLVDSRIETCIVPRIESILDDEWFLLIVMWNCMDVSKSVYSHGLLTGWTIEQRMPWQDCMQKYIEDCIKGCMIVSKEDCELIG